MPSPLRIPAAEFQIIDIAALSRPWIGGALAYSRWLIAVLDGQTALCKDMERQTANLLQLWLGPTAPAPSAQPLVDAVQGLALLGPAALRKSWADGMQVWVSALRHDAAEA